MAAMYLLFSLPDGSIDIAHPFLAKTRAIVHSGGSLEGPWATGTVCSSCRIVYCRPQCWSVDPVSASCWNQLALRAPGSTLSEPVRWSAVRFRLWAPTHNNPSFTRIASIADSKQWHRSSRETLARGDLAWSIGTALWSPFAISYRRAVLPNPSPSDASD